MGKTIGILLGVLGIWFGVEVYLNGTDGAVDSMLGRSESTETPAARTTAQRAGDSVEGSHAAANARRDRMLTD